MSVPESFKAKRGQTGMSVLHDYRNPLTVLQDLTRIGNAKFAQTLKNTFRLGFENSGKN